MSLATFATTVAQRRTAAVAALIIIGVVSIGAPFASLRGDPVPAFMPINVTMIAIIDLVTAFLFFRQCIASRLRSVVFFGSAYLWTGTIVIAYLVTFPDGNGTTYALGAGPQSAIWLWVCWKIGFVALILASVVEEIRSRGERASEASISRILAWLPPALVIAVLTLAWFAIAHADRLPPLIVDRAYTPLFTAYLCPLITAGCAIAGGLLFLRTRGANVAHLWLMITCLAVAAEVLLTSLGSTRFSVGFYAARMESLVVASVVLFALLHESGRLASAVAAAERQARAIVASVADALLTIDEGGVILDANPAAMRLFGYERSAFAQHCIAEVIVDFSEHRRSQRGASAFEATGKHKSGDTFPLEVTVGDAGNAFDEAEVRSTIIIARDITARKRAESAIATARDQAIETARLKAQFLATMSHEIRTPINAVIGMTELLLATDLSGERRAFAETVRDSAESLLDVINDILDFSKIEAGKLELESIAFAPGDLLESAVDILAGNARAKSLSLLTLVEPDVPDAVLGDANRLRQVLLNLIGNAIKFTASGAVTVRVGIGRSMPGTSLRFSIADSGIGIGHDALAQLFEPFQQVDGSTSRRYGGSGLGLSISKKLVEMMGGTIAVESTIAAGSTFSFELPVEVIESQVGVTERRPALPGGFRALVVDANDETRAIVATYLEGWGAIVEVAPAEEVRVRSEAAFARGRSFDVILIDAASAQNVPIASLNVPAIPRILLAGIDDMKRARDAREPGYATFVRKPLRRAALFDALALALTGTPVEPQLGDHAGPGSTHDGVRILLAEDHPVNQKLALRQLEKLGYRADVVSNGREAVEAFCSQAYTLVLMDCQMPELDGFGAARAIRAREADTGGRIPIVAMTANALAGDREACLAAGMDDYLPKPVQMGALAAMIERFSIAASPR